MMSGKTAAIVLFVSLLIFAVTLRDSGRDYACRDCNVVLISLDTLRADHLSSYGYPLNTSPHIDDLAAKGILFENAISQASWTMPSHAALFTSLYPSDMELFYFPYPGLISDNVTVLTELLKAEGYATAGFHGGSFLSEGFGFSQGFDVYKSNGPRMEDNTRDIYSWLSENHDKKFFLFLHNFNVHGPYTPPKTYTRYFTNYSTPTDLKSHIIDVQRLYDEKGGIPPENKSSLDYIISQYDGEIAYVDHLLGQFIGELVRYGLLNNTLIIVTSDHGEEFLEHGHFDHVRTLYDELVRVPLIVWAPTLPEGRRVSKQVMLVDVMPTVLDLLGIKYSGDVRGLSLVSFVLGGGIERPALSETGSTFPRDIPKNTLISYQRSVRSGGWKLIYGRFKVNMTPADGSIQRVDTVSSYQLFDLSTDSGEHVDVYDKERLRAFSLSRRLVGAPVQAEAPQEPANVSDSVKQQLKGMGYLT
ncbi:MAG: sulfatase [Candidatus Altiarchaeota archaeon]